MEVEGDALGDEFKGYVFKIMGGQDKQGFPMKQGVQVPGRVKLLMTPGEEKHFLGHGRKKGERRRKAVRGQLLVEAAAQGSPRFCHRVPFFSGRVRDQT